MFYGAKIKMHNLLRAVFGFWRTVVHFKYAEIRMQNRATRTAPKGTEKPNIEQEKARPWLSWDEPACRAIEPRGHGPKSNQNTMKIFAKLNGATRASAGPPPWSATANQATACTRFLPAADAAGEPVAPVPTASRRGAVVPVFPATFHLVLWRPFSQIIFLCDNSASGRLIPMPGGGPQLPEILFVSAAQRCHDAGEG